MKYYIILKKENEYGFTVEQYSTRHFELLNKGYYQVFDGFWLECCEFEAYESWLYWKKNKDCIYFTQSGIGMAWTEKICHQSIKENIKANINREQRIKEMFED